MFTSQLRILITHILCSSFFCLLLVQIHWTTPFQWRRSPPLASARSSRVLLVRYISTEGEVVENRTKNLSIDIVHHFDMEGNISLTGPQSQRLESIAQTRFKKC